MEIVKVSPKFQIVIPKKVREALHLEPGQELHVYAVDNTIRASRPRPIKELRGMDNSVYTKRLRVAGNVEPGSIHRTGLHVEFTLVEQGNKLPVVYTGTEAPPDTFKDNAQALAEGSFGRDGVFHASELQAKCASKYAPAQQNAPAAPAKDMSQADPGATGLPK